MAFGRHTIIAGAVMEITEKEIVPAYHSHGRRGKSEKTKKEQEIINRKNAMLRLMRLLNANYKQGDYMLTLTFAEDPTQEVLDREKANFLRRLKRNFKKKTGEDLRAVMVTEAGNKYGRLHIHMIVPAFDLTPAQLQKLWGKGLVDMQVLDGDPYWRWLMVYLEKAERTKKYRCRWSCTRNLLQPVVLPPKVLKRGVLTKEPKVPKGYTLLDYHVRAGRFGAERYIVCLRTDCRGRLPGEYAKDMTEWAKDAVFDGIDKERWKCPEKA